MIHSFGPLRHLHLWNVAAFETDGNKKGSQGQMRPKRRPSNLKAPTLPAPVSPTINNDNENEPNYQSPVEAKRIADINKRRNDAAGVNLKARSKANLRVDDARKAAATSGNINSKYQDFMNRMTPNDGKEFVGGNLMTTKAEGLTGYQPGPTLPGLIGLGQKALRGLGGVTEGDSTVGSVDGKDIYERYDGSTYAINMLGMPYDTVSGDSLEAKPMSEAQKRMMAEQQNQSNDSDGGLAYSMGGGSTGVFGSAPTNPCPTGYVMNPQTNACEIDPFQAPFAPAPTTGVPAATANAQFSPVSSYTAATPYAMPTLNPGPQTAFNVPVPNTQPITVAQQGLGSLPFRSS